MVLQCFLEQPFHCGQAQCFLFLFSCSSPDGLFRHGVLTTGMLVTDK